MFHGKDHHRTRDGERAKRHQTPRLSAAKAHDHSYILNASKRTRMDPREVLRVVSFGARVAEDETEVLANYFVETDLWHQIWAGGVDIIYGAKGSGKSALYSLLLSRGNDLLVRRIILVAGENPRGATAFRDLTIDPPASEREAIGLWKLYVLALVQHALAEHAVRSAAADELFDALEREGLTKGTRSLSSVLRRALTYVRRVIRPEAVEGQLVLDPATQLPSGLRGKITFSDTEEQRDGPGMHTVDELLLLANRALAEAGLAIWIALDRLDVAFADAPELETNLLRALFRVYLDLLALPALRLKIFLRSDIWNRLTSKGFREASHITRSMTIDWTRNALLNLIVRRFLHNPIICETWNVSPKLADSSVKEQASFFDRLCPEWIAEDARDVPTFEWTLLHTRDGSKATMPRELIHFFACLRETQAKKLEIGEDDIEFGRLFSGSAFRTSLATVSRARLEQTLLAEHPNQRPWIEKLRGAKALQTPQSLAKLWSLDATDTAARSTTLVDIGFFEKRGTEQAPEFWVPYLYSETLDMDQRPAGAEVAERIRSYVTPSLPLGPSDAAQLQDVAAAAKMFDAHNRSFGALLRRDVAVVIGRRGSGKTALLRSYIYRPYLDSVAPSSLETRSDFYSYSVVIEVEIYRQFDEMQRMVVRDTEQWRPIEAIVDDWESLLVDYMLAQFVVSETDAGRARSELDLIRRYLTQEENEHRRETRLRVWGSLLLDRVRHALRGTTDAVRLTREAALSAMEQVLAQSSRRAVMLIDSFDEYNLASEVFNRTLGALIRFVSHFNRVHDVIKIKMALPIEIFPEVQHASANPLKDLVNVDQIIWTTSELLQIVARRFLVFLSLYDREFAEFLSRYDLNKRASVREFWGQFFRQKHVNECGSAEDPLTYVMRHTYLLPRQVLMLFQKIIVRSAEMSGGYRALTDLAVADAVETVCPLIAAEIFGAYRHVFPAAEKVSKVMFSGFPVAFSYEELENRWRKRGRPVALASAPDVEFPPFCELMLRMGVIGIVTDETSQYLEATFSYDSAAPTNVGDGSSLCLHPIFRRHFNASAVEPDKAVMPRGSGAW